MSQQLQPESRKTEKNVKHKLNKTLERHKLSYKSDLLMLNPANSVS